MVDPRPGEPAPLALAFAGGGTGGHVVPGLHLVAHLRRRGVPLAPLLWFGAGRPIEDRVFAGARAGLAGLELERVVLDLEPPRGGAPSLGRLLVRALPGARTAARALRAHGTAVVVGLGGYTSLPVVLAARRLGLPVVLLEINAVRGRATRWMAPLATRVVHAWQGSLPARPSEKHRCLGPPLAPAFGDRPASPAERRAARAALGFDPGRPLLLVLGGSQGAQALNVFCRGHADALAERGIQLLQQVGPGRLEEGVRERPGQRAKEYLDDVPLALRAATAVLCRGGASTLAEIGALARPAFVVPYPHHPDRHQEQNALALRGGVEIVPEARLGPAFVAELVRLLGPEGVERREAMARALASAVPRDGAERLVDLLLDLARRPGAREGA